MRLVALAIAAGMSGVLMGATDAYAQGQVLAEGTLLLGEVMYALTPEDVARGGLTRDEPPQAGLAERLRQRGFTDAQIAAGRVIVVREGERWNNSVSGIHQDMLNTVLLAEGLRVEAGNIVESRVGKPVTAVRIRARNMADGRCRFDELPTSVVKALLGVLSMVGPSGAATLYCEGIQQEGWIRPRTYWHRPPEGAMSAAEPARTTTPAPSALPASGAAAVAAEGGAVTGARTSGETFQDCADCPEMIVLAAGRYDMGSRGTEAFDDEGPVHAVSVQSFAIGKYHVTRAQYAAFVKQTGRRSAGRCNVFERGKWGTKKGVDWQSPGFPQDDRHPATCITFEDARAYVTWLAEITNRPYRLPSEAEWEYAARAGTTTERYWGDAPEAACRYANVADASLQVRPRSGFQVHACSDGYAFTSPVGSFAPNAFGLHDMLGNLWQWAEDSYHPSYLGAPIDERPWTGAAGRRVCRGGSWLGAVVSVRSARRDWGDVDAPANDTGLRVALTLH